MYGMMNKRKPLPYHEILIHRKRHLSRGICESRTRPKKMVSVDDEDGDDTAALALASLRKATKELNELADFCEQNYCDEPATGLKL